MGISERIVLYVCVAGLLVTAYGFYLVIRGI
jgi:hypothetical protein